MSNQKEKQEITELVEFIAALKAIVNEVEKDDLTILAPVSVEPVKWPKGF